MGWSEPIIAAAGVLAIVAVAGAVAGQASPQTVTATLEGEVAEEPDERPGTYTTPTNVTLEASGGRCLCTETQVTFVPQAEGANVSADPAEITIAWPDAGGSASKAVELALEVGDVDGPIEVTVDAEMTHQPEDGHITDQTNPAQFTLADPTSDEQAANASANGTQAEQQSSTDGEEASGVPAPGLVSVAIAATGALGLRRAR